MTVSLFYRTESSASCSSSNSSSGSDREAPSLPAGRTGSGRRVACVPARILDYYRLSAQAPAGPRPLAVNMTYPSFPLLRPEALRPLPPARHIPSGSQGEPVPVAPLTPQTGRPDALSCDENRPLLQEASDNQVAGTDGGAHIPFSRDSDRLLSELHPPLCLAPEGVLR